MNSTSVPSVPPGMFCYSYTGNIAIVSKSDFLNQYVLFPEIKNCPFWHGHTAGAFCAKLNHHSAVGSKDMLWNKIKICEESSEEEQHKLFPQETLIMANKRARRYPNFISSIKNILETFEYRYFKYDDITYTLGHDI